MVGWMGGCSLIKAQVSSRILETCSLPRLAHVRSVGDWRPGTSELSESLRLNEPYGLLSSSSHML